jgi:hypothetical protein
MRRQLLREFLVEGVSHRELMPVSIPASCPLAQLLVQEVEDIPDTVAELREAAEDI